jgi:addiction module RelE/StbE family toxin
MRNVSITTKFKKDFKLVKKTPKFKKYAFKFEEYVEKIRKGEPLPPESHDKPMSKQSDREYQGCREFHAAPDVVVIYRRTTDTVELVRIGQHNNLELFEKLEKSF